MLHIELKVVRQEGECEVHSQRVECEEREPFVLCMNCSRFFYTIPKGGGGQYALTGGGKCAVPHAKRHLKA